MLNRPVSLPVRTVCTQPPRRYRPWTEAASLIAAACCAGVWLAPSAHADSAANFRQAVDTLRGATLCGPLHYDPLVEQVAQVINKSLDDYLNHTARDVPIEDPLPGLKTLGYGGSKGKLISGAAETDAGAIKGAVVQGYKDIPDCSYTDYGLSVQQNARTGNILAALVLAGP